MCNDEGFINYLSKKDRSLDHEWPYQEKICKADSKNFFKMVIKVESRIIENITVKYILL